jgi:hypothetical protein
LKLSKRDAEFITSVPENTNGFWEAETEGSKVDDTDGFSVDDFDGKDDEKKLGL